MLDQTSSVDNPVHLIVRAPVELQTRYAGYHPEVREFIDSWNGVANAKDESEQEARREELAAKAEQLRKKFSEKHLSSLAQLLEYAAELLRGGYPLHPVRPLPALHMGTGPANQAIPQKG